MCIHNSVIQNGGNKAVKEKVHCASHATVKEWVAEGAELVVECVGMK